MERKIAIHAAEAGPVWSRSNYPEEFAARVAGRARRRLGEAFGLTNFGVNLTVLQPGAWSSLRHRHSRQDEFVYALEGEAVLVTEFGETVLRPGMCAGFQAGGVSHHLQNRSDRPFTYLEIGDRTGGDEVTYPDEDLVAVAVDGKWRFLHKDGTPY